MTEGGRNPQRQIARSSSARLQLASTRKALESHEMRATLRDAEHRDVKDASQQQADVISHLEKALATQECMTKEVPLPLMPPGTEFVV